MRGKKEEIHTPGDVTQTKRSQIKEILQSSVEQEARLGKKSTADISHEHESPTKTRKQR